MSIPVAILETKGTRSDLALVGSKGTFL